MSYRRRIEKKIVFGKVIRIDISDISGENLEIGAKHGKNISIYTSEEKGVDLDIPDGENPHYRWNSEPSLFWLTIAMIVSQTNAIFVPVYGWVCWDISIGFHGDGYEYFKAK